MKSLMLAARVEGVDVYFHWSTFAIGAVLLVSAGTHLFEAGVALAAYFGVLLVHEWGHVMAARRKRCVPWRVEIYPIHGRTYFSAPASQFDAGVIAWGGSLLQLAIATPLVAWVSVFGFTPFGAVNAILALLGYFSVLIAVLNLLPIPLLDGSKAWPIVPALVRRLFASSARGIPVPRRQRRRTKPWVH